MNLLKNIKFSLLGILIGVVVGLLLGLLTGSMLLAIAVCVVAGFCFGWIYDNRAPVGVGYSHLDA
jgi:ABC-type Mn2+/Zn2+ transport system permease subunit